MPRVNVVVGGWGNTGTRLIVQILQKYGCEIFPPHLNRTMDIMGLNFREKYQRYYETGDETVFDDLQGIVQGVKDWVIKHGHFILDIPKVREKFPGAKVICCARHPLDMVMKGEDDNYRDFGVTGTSDPGIPGKLRTIEYWYSQKDWDLLVHLEDLLERPAETIRVILDAAGIDDPVRQDVVDLIGQPSPSVGRGVGVLQAYEAQARRACKLMGYPRTS